MTPGNRKTEALPTTRRRALTLIGSLSFVVGVLTLVASALAAATPTASAAVPKLLTRIGGSAGSAAGQISSPGGIATSSTGHVYVADELNNRVDEFTPWGEFVKAFGWDVAPGAVDEEQEVRLRATAGRFTLSFGASTTTDLPFDATAGEVQSALNGLASIASGGGSVSVSGGAGGIAGTTPSVYVVRFSGGPLAEADVAQLSAASGNPPLSGGTPATGLTVGTRANGTAGGTGLEACTAASGCKAALSGAGAGEFGLTIFPASPRGVAVDPSGNIYAFDVENYRVQKFDSSGSFLLMFGGEVNKTSGEDVCTKEDLEDGDVCGAGIKGTGDSEFSMGNFDGVLGDFLDIGPSGLIYAGDKDRIQEFQANGDFAGQIRFADVNAEDATFPATGASGALAIDPVTGDLYLAFAVFPWEYSPLERHGVFRLNSAGELLDTLIARGPETVADGPEALATDKDGNLYVSDLPIITEGHFGRLQVVEFDSSGSALIGYGEGFNDVTATLLYGLATNTAGDILVSNFVPPEVSYVNVYGPAPVALEPPLKVAPSINDQYAVSVESDGATVKATINPHFWADTRYYVEYGLSSCAAGGCAKTPAPPGSMLTGEVVDAPLTSAGVFLAGLAPATTYHYRFVAQSSGGGPVVGIGGAVGADGAEGTFTTPPSAREPDRNCANQAFRTGASASLPDCRAYEMVSPVDKGGGDIAVLCEALCYPAALDQSASSGDKLTYSSYRAFGNAQSAPFTSQYLSSRGPEGWSNEGISPPQTGASLLGNVADGDTMYKAFSPDLSKGWLLQGREPAPSPGAPVPNLYQRDNTAGLYRALVPDTALQSVPELQGISGDGRCAIFAIEDKLTGNAKVKLRQLYESCGGNVQLVSILPNETASGQASMAGTPGTGPQSRSDSVYQAISEDGSRIFWSENDSTSGKLYVRVGGAETKLISGGKLARFWGAAADGSRAIYMPTEGGKEDDLLEFDVAEGVSTLIADEAEGVMGMSKDASLVYFVSDADLDASGPAQANRPNLYLHRAGASNSFIAALSPADLPGELSPVHPEPIRHTARVSADGEHLAFMSSASLTGFDNTDVASGEADAEVFLYDADSGALVCVSCNSTGARPSGHRLTVAGSLNTSVLWGAAQIPTFENELYGSRVLSEDGKRLFFESFEALVPSDTNGRTDVYQWEALGVGSCDEGSPSSQASSGGCVELISSGQSPSDVAFVDASASGSDVFFTTASSLLPQDPGLVDIYDARVNGGFAPEPSPPPSCEGEACQGPLSPPNDPTPTSATFQGAGNVVEAPHKKKAHKKRAHKKKAHKKKRHHRANHKRRAKQ